jgi:hypothetical protein
MGDLVVIVDDVLPGLKEKASSPCVAIKRGRVNLIHSFFDP